MVDARGLLCPMPVVMVQKAVKDGHPAEIEVLLDDACAEATSISAPNRPCCGSKPRLRHSCRNCSYSGTACSGRAAPVKLGRLPLRQSA